MNEAREHLPADPRSYESQDGDVQPYADIEEPHAYEEDFGPTEADFLAADADFDQSAELKYDVVAIPTTPEKERSEQYSKAKTIIEEGIAASTAADLTMYVVQVWRKATHLRTGKEVEMTLSEFLSADLSTMVPSDEYGDLLNEYTQKNIDYAVQHGVNLVKETAELVDDVVEKKPPTSSTSKKLGAVASKVYTPRASHGSGLKQYRDFQSAAANDYNEDDEE